MKVQSNNTLSLTTNLAVGETKEFKVVLKWTNGQMNFGTLTNIAELSNVSNQVNYEETSLQDNQSKSELILNIKTGLNKNITIIGLIIGSLFIISCGIVFIKKKCL